MEVPPFKETAKWTQIEFSFCIYMFKFTRSSPKKYMVALKSLGLPLGKRKKIMRSPAIFQNIRFQWTHKIYLKLLTMIHQHMKPSHCQTPRLLKQHQKRPQVKAQREQFASAEAEAKEKTQKAEAIWDGKGRLSSNEVIPDVRWWVVKVLNSWEMCWLKGFWHDFLVWFFKFASSNLWEKNLGWSIFPSNYGWSHWNFLPRKPKQNQREIDGKRPPLAWATHFRRLAPPNWRRWTKSFGGPSKIRRRKIDGKPDSREGKRQGEQNTWWSWFF